MQLVKILNRSLRLRCPRCGLGRVFSGWFRMFPRCSHCDLVFNREPGYFLGSIYFNYGLTAAIVVVAGTLGYLLDVRQDLLPIGLAVFCLTFPLWFFRYARCLWMGFDELFDPRPTKPVEAMRIIDQAIRKRQPDADGVAQESPTESASDSQ